MSEKMALETETRGADKQVNGAEEGFYGKVVDPNLDDDGLPRRTGTWKTGTAHIITAVIGSGVLGLGWAIAQIGWVFGPLILLGFAWITWYTAQLLCDAYRVGDPITGKRNYTYMDAVKSHLGPINVFFCGVAQYSNLWATGVGYTVTGSTSLMAAKKAICFHNNPGTVSGDSPCYYNNLPWMIFFGALQLGFAQVPNFGGLWWLSYLATIMSFMYASIGLGLSIGQVTEPRAPVDSDSVQSQYSYGTAWGTADDGEAPAVAAWNVFVGLGSMAFAYSFSMIMIEITDTMAQPPAENLSMRKATKAGIGITTFFYMTIGCISYAAFGDTTPGNLLTGFGFYNPYWLVALANIGVFVHLIGAYQVYMMPLLQAVDLTILQNVKHPAVHYELVLNIPWYGPFPISPLRLVTRSCIVISTTVVALLLPFFNDVVGLIGAMGFWPLTVYFPIELYIAATGIPRWSKKWWYLEALSFFCLLITLVAAIGSVAYIVIDTKGYQPFHSYS